MYKITFHSDTDLSTITNKPTKVDFIRKPKIIIDLFKLMWYNRKNNNKRSFEYD